MLYPLFSSPPAPCPTRSTYEYDVQAKGGALGWMKRRPETDTLTINDKESTQGVGRLRVKRGVFCSWLNTVAPPAAVPHVAIKLSSSTSLARGGEQRRYIMIVSDLSDASCLRPNCVRSWGSTLVRLENIQSRTHTFASSLFYISSLTAIPDDTNWGTIDCFEYIDAINRKISWQSWCRPIVQST